MKITLIASFISAALAFGSAWQIQSWRADAKEKDRAEQRITDQQATFKAFERDQNKVITAQSDAMRRVVVLRRDASAARTELDGLRSANSDALRAAATGRDACLERAATYGQLLSASAAAYQELAGKADGHVSDVKTLVQAWPQ